MRHLVATRNPLNIGAAARAMSNFGLQRLRVVSPYDAAFREARSAVGASRLLAGAEEYQSVAEAVADCTLVVGTTAVGHRQLQHSLLHLADGAPLIRAELDAIELRGAGNDPHRIAVLFGSEKFGLSNESLSHCDWLMHVPTSEEQPSMNLGQAVAVCLYELVRDSKTVQRPEQPEPASAGELERMTSALLQVLYASEYMSTRPSHDKEEIVRRLVRRLHATSADVEIWLGMLRQIAWKLRTKD